jgi:putative transposase
MGRPLRVVEPHGIYHVGARGNNKQLIFDDTLRSIFLWQLSEVAREHDWWVYAWALMSNHFHVVLQIGEKGLSDGMHRLNSFFARASNAHFDRTNHCFGQRFWSSFIDSDAYLYSCIRYVLWNPARAAQEDSPGECTWTSYRASVGLDWAQNALDQARLLDFFGRSPKTARADFESFVLAGAERCLQPWGDGEGIVR